ncbi:MAG: hypothetical protein LIO85_02665 [Rikenellaceae bacterium]|nr:hypothetical protein [Rikenellaceae bacterium]
MKKPFLIMLAGALACGTAPAQGDAGGHRHTLSVSAGAWPSTYDQEVFDGRSSVWGCWFYDPDLNGLWSGEGDTYYGDMRTSGAVSLSYGYRALPWLAVKLSATYTGIYQKSYSAADGSRRDDLSRHYFYFMPGVDFFWLRRPCVEMYSGLEIGAGFVVADDWDYSNKGFAGGQLTLAGIRIGRGRFYFMSELGFGMRGIATAGGGIRF